ncbi:MAG: DUF86 domain-containing protein [Candidatus Eisenbacteria bacterium]|nr:DUF86 domain-containing protein [Candidatus Eisenbacteria bacterium]
MPARAHADWRRESLVDRDVFDRRLGRLEDLLSRLRSVAKLEWKSYKTDQKIQAATERWLHLAAECTIDLAHHLIADRGLKTPGTYREAFQILHEAGVLTEDVARSMESWAGLRNVLVHMYIDVDAHRLFEILQKDLDQLESFAAAMSKAVSGGEPPRGGK